MSPPNMDFELAGDHAVMSVSEDGTLTVAFNDKGTGRECGKCQLCCKLLPIPVIQKPANQRCEHQSHARGCRVYSRRPQPCQVFFCRWLGDRSTQALSRPDRSHYVIDVMPDSFEMQNLVTGEPTTINAFQVWVDPAFPEAHKDPRLRDWMHEMAKLYGAATIVRSSPSSGFVVFPPPFDHEKGEWHEMGGDFVPKNEMDRAIANNFRIEAS